jgi:hypothetical protein
MIDVHSGLTSNPAVRVRPRSCQGRRRATWRDVGPMRQNLLAPIGARVVIWWWKNGMVVGLVVGTRFHGVCESSEVA